MKNYIINKSKIKLIIISDFLNIFTLISLSEKRLPDIKRKKYYFMH